MDLIVFQHEPFGMITIQAGQMGYCKKTRIRLKRHRDGYVYFETKNNDKFIQKRDNPREFVREKNHNPVIP